MIHFQLSTLLSFVLILILVEQSWTVQIRRESEIFMIR
jgi:hypothetical protein